MNLRGIACFKDGVLIESYKSVAIGSREVGMGYSELYSLCSGNKIDSNGRTWEFTEKSKKTMHKMDDMLQSLTAYCDS